MRERWPIFKHLLKKWFIIDVISIIPFEIFGFVPVEIDSIALIKQRNYSDLFKLLRLFELNSRFKFQLKFSDIFKIGSAAIRLLKFFLTVLICINFMGCLWQFTSKMH